MHEQDAERKTGLCISRKVGQTVEINTSDGVVVVRLTKVSQHRVRLRFEAPAKVRIFRGEALMEAERRT